MSRWTRTDRYSTYEYYLPKLQHIWQPVELPSPQVSSRNNNMAIFSSVSWQGRCQSYNYYEELLQTKPHQTQGGLIPTSHIRGFEWPTTSTCPKRAPHQSPMCHQCDHSRCLSKHKKKERKRTRVGKSLRSQRCLACFWVLYLYATYIQVIASLLIHVWEDLSLSHLRA